MKYGKLQRALLQGLFFLLFFFSFSFSSRFFPVSYPFPLSFFFYFLPFFLRIPSLFNILPPARSVEWSQFTCLEKKNSDLKSVFRCNHCSWKAKENIEKYRIGHALNSWLFQLTRPPRLHLPLPPLSSSSSATLRRVPPLHPSFSRRRHSHRVYLCRNSQLQPPHQAQATAATLRNRPNGWSQF